MCGRKRVARLLRAAGLAGVSPHPDHQRRGIGRALVRAAAVDAARAGCAWLHVDCGPHVRPFYRDVCGFRFTDAALLHLVELEQGR